RPDIPGQPANEDMVSKDVGLELDKPVSRAPLSEGTPLHEGGESRAHLDERGETTRLSDELDRGVVLSIDGSDKGDPAKERTDLLRVHVGLALLDLDEILVGERLCALRDLLQITVVFEVLDG